MRHNISRFALLWGLLTFALLTAFPLHALAAGSTGTITGQVTNTANAALSGATVTAGGISATTDSNGHYTLSGVAVGSQSVSASQTLYLGASATVTVVLNTTVTAPVLKLAQNWGTMAVHVQDVRTAVSISGATISLAGTSRTGVTNSSGNYTFTSVPAGSQTISVTAANYQTASYTGVVPVGTLTPYVKLTAAAPATGSVTGYVTDAVTTAVIPSATVAVAGTSLTATTNSLGQYTVAQVPTGSQTLTVSARGYQTASQTAVVAGSATVTANFQLTQSISAGSGSTILWNGANNYLLGADYAWYNYGTDFGTGAWGKFTNWATVGSGFTAMSSKGVHVVRYWVFADGRYSPEFNSNGTVSGLDSTVMSDVDQILQIAANSNTYLLLTVIDSSMWSSATYSGSLQMGGRSTMVTNAAVQQSFLDNALKPLLQHITASVNKDRVLGYDIVNEPEANMSGYWGGVNLPASQVQTFVQNCATYIHTYGGGAYATVGSATPYYVSVWKNLGLDFYEFHYYPWMDFSNGAGSGLPTYTSLNLDKPCIVGEFPTVDANFTLGSTVPLSAQWYLDSVYNKGYAGALAWSFTVPDSASNWTSFQPVFTNWANTHSAYVGPK